MPAIRPAFPDNGMSRVVKQAWMPGVDSADLFVPDSWPESPDEVGIGTELKRIMLACSNSSVRLARCDGQDIRW
jgi:hypothetical protein